MTRPVSFNAVRAGITRLRTKGGANPESLFDLVNAYVTSARTIKPRPGSIIHAEGLAGTAGLAAMNGQLYVFASAEPPAPMPSNVKALIVNPPAGVVPEPTIVRIWKAAPFMGQLYVVVEWSDDNTRAIHYWLQTPGDWLPEHVYMLNQAVTPSVSTGFTYRATRLNPAAAPWTSGKEHDVGDVVEPTVFNGYEYIVREAFGNPPRSGATEPVWLTGEGSLVVEDADVTALPELSSGSDGYVPPGYENPGGNLPDGFNKITGDV